MHLRFNASQLHASILLLALSGFTVAVSADQGAKRQLLQCSELSQVTPVLPARATTTGSYPYGLPGALLNSTNRGTSVCTQPAPNSKEFDYVSQIQLTTEISTQRLVGIAFTCSLGRTFSAYSGGRSGPTSLDSNASATGGGPRGGFNAVTLEGGLLSQPTDSGGDIVSGVQFSYVDNCDASQKNASTVVIGGSKSTYYGNMAIEYNFCRPEDLVIGFHYGTGDYFEGLMPLLFEFFS